MGVGAGWEVPHTHAHTWVGVGWMGGSVGQWVGSCQITKNLINLYLIEIIQCACACTHAHVCMVNMIISCKWLPPLGESLGIPYDVIHACVCVCTCVHACACACVWEAPSYHPPPTSTQPPHPPGGTPGISQNSIALELIKIFQFRLKIWNLWRLSHPWVGILFGLMGGVRSKH